jgi:hypothetical protein
MEQMSQVAPDLVLMDLTPEITFPGLGEMKHAIMTCKIVLWVNSICTELSFQAMGSALRSILRKTLPTELQVKCLQKAQTGELWFEKALTERFLCARRVALTQREGQLAQAALARSEKQSDWNHPHDFGRQKVYLSRLFQKVGVKDRFELALFALKNLTTGQLRSQKKRACRERRHARSALPGVSEVFDLKPTSIARGSVIESPSWRLSGNFSTSM